MLSIPGSWFLAAEAEQLDLSELVTAVCTAFEHCTETEIRDAIETFIASAGISAWVELEAPWETLDELAAGVREVFERVAAEDHERATRWSEAMRRSLGFVLHTANPEIGLNEADEDASEDDENFQQLLDQMNI